MNDSDFEELIASVKEAGRIKRDEMEPARTFEVRPAPNEIENGHPKLKKAKAQ